MPSFCPNCATALDPDAKFCPSCSAPVTVSAALASELRAGVQAGVRSLIQAPSLKVPPPVWGSSRCSGFS
jgi:predicted amidophosphoribosyltransferase